ncbi:MAG: metallophosphoesterase [Methylococcales bacterium]
MVKVHVLSDLHNEFLRNNKINSSHLWEGKIPETDADVIVLAGDIDVGTAGVKWAVSESERLSKPILYVLGNHEFYHEEYKSMKKLIKSFAEGTDVHILDGDEFVFNGVRFLGVTLWTAYNLPGIYQDWARQILDAEFIDHQVIRYEFMDKESRFLTKDAYALHSKDMVWLKDKLSEKFDGKTVVISHHGPHMVCQHPGFPESETSMAFHSDLSNLFEKYKIDTWIYGHTHANVDVNVIDTRLISNQAGYPGERVIDFDIKKIIEI